jgi:putative redox protein
MGKIQEISSVYSTGMAFTTTLNDYNITTDTETDAGGAGKGPRPKALMLVALTGCTGVDVVSILQKMKVAFTDLRIDVKADLSDEIASIYEKVHLTYYIKVAYVDQDKVDKAVSLSMDKYCGVSAMFSKFATLSREIVFL